MFILWYLSINYPLKTNILFLDKKTKQQQQQLWG